MSTDRALSFGPFCLLPDQRKLLENGRPVRLGSRALDLLIALVDRAGDVIPSAELIARVWPNTVVEPGALRVHIVGLRKVLGDGRAGHRYVVNVPSKGYCFVAPVERVSVGAAAPASTPSMAVAPAARSGVQPDATSAPLLPAQVTRMIGRDEVVAELVRELPRRRCITLVGPAGMGKTTVALATAHAVASSFDGQVVFVALAPLSDPALLTGSVISALGLATLAADPLRGLLAYLRERRMLIVLDNCEHLIAASADLAEQLLSGALGVHLLVTSREPLRTHGEWVRRLTSLSVPPPLAKLTAGEALQVPSVELFVERARASLDSFELTEVDVAAVTEICRALDGIPLALELAAAGVERLGVRGVASNLGNRLALLTRGRRTALPRHQTLRAALDWGYALLTPSEQGLLRRLSIFRGRFSAASAAAVCAHSGASGVEEDLFNLVSKSFLVSDIGGEAVQYWFLETTREYATSLRDASGETAELAERHARHMLDLADAGEREREAGSPGEWLADHAHLIDDYRAALEWSLAAGSDARVGVALAGASAPLWFALSLMAEYLRIAERAMAAVQGDALDPRREMALCEAHGNALWHIRGAAAQAVSTFERALEIAERVGSKADRLRALWGLWLIAISGGDYAQVVRLAERFGEAAAGSKDLASPLVHQRMMAVSLHFIGRHTESRSLAEKLLDQPVVINASARNSGFHFEQRVAVLTGLARNLWMQGYPDQAFAHAQQAMDRALEINHSISLCYALASACTPVAIWTGDWERAARLTRLLLERAKKYSLDYWQAYGEGFELVLRRREGSTEGLEALENPALGLIHRDLLCTLDAQLADEAALARAESEAGGWCAPELLRLRGERARSAGDPEAARWFRRGMELARAQQALSWELRNAMSLAKLLKASGSTGEAHEVLGSVVQRFTEGFDTADLRDASAFLAQLDPGR